MEGTYSDFFRVFSQVSKSIHSGESTTEILEHIVRNITEILLAKGCIYWIVDHGRERIETMVSHGFAYRSLANVNYRELVGLFNSEPGPLVWIEDAKTDPRIPAALHLMERPSTTRKISLSARKFRRPHVHLRFCFSK